MKKRSYRRISLKSVSVENVMEKLGGHRRLVFAVDVAKTDMVAALADPAAEPERRVLMPLSWKHPEEHPALRALLEGLLKAGVQVEAVMEPSGTYGDALRHQLQQVGIEVYRVNAHRTFGAAEVYDGVASLHDAKAAHKAAHILSKLHLDGASRLWQRSSEQERTMSAAIAMMDLYRGERQRELGRLQGLLARHWPELLSAMELGSATQFYSARHGGWPRASTGARRCGRGAARDDEPGLHQAAQGASDRRGGAQRRGAAVPGRAPDAADAERACALYAARAALPSASTPHIHRQLPARISTQDALALGGGSVGE
jgi:hypothetical protein